MHCMDTLEDVIGSMYGGGKGKNISTKNVLGKSKQNMRILGHTGEKFKQLGKTN